jgi:hypothetical protein
MLFMKYRPEGVQLLDEPRDEGCALRQVIGLDLQVSFAFGHTEKQADEYFIFPLALDGFMCYTQKALQLYSSLKHETPSGYRLSPLDGVAP